MTRLLSTLTLVGALACADAATAPDAHARQQRAFTMTCDTIAVGASGKVKFRNCAGEVDTATPPPAPAAPWPAGPIRPAVPAYVNACDTLPGCIDLAPGDNWQTKISAAPAGARFRVLPGTHAPSAYAVPKSGQEFHGPGIHRGTATTSCSSAATVTGGGTVNQFLRYQDGVPLAGLVVKGFAVTGFTGAYSSTNYSGAIMLFSGVVSGAVVEHMCFTRNTYAGATAGPRTTLRFNVADSNGTMGLGGYRADGSVVTDNVARWNNPTKATPAGALSAVAGIKFLQTDTATFARNWLEDNYGTNLWFDSQNTHITADSNTSLGGRKGIWFEISNAGNTALRNYVQDAGRGDGDDPCPTSWVDAAAIMASNSDGVEVAFNHVVGGCDGIIGTESPRTDNPTLLRNFSAHHNFVEGVLQTSAGLAWSGTTNRDVIYTGGTNRFAENEYARAAASPFHWLQAARTWTYWQGTAKQDTTGTLAVSP